MTRIPDRDVRQWMETWQSSVADSAGPPEAIHRYVQLRTRLLRFWLAGEVAVVLAVTPLLLRAAIRGDTIERAAMALLALIVACAIAFSWWNWHGAMGAAGETTTAFLEVSKQRIRRLARAITAGWALLAAEILVFVPWIAYRLYGGATSATPTAQLFSWGLLATLTGLAAAGLAGLSVWARREQRQLDALQQELTDDVPDSGRPD